MSWAELGDKFRDCADLVLPRKNAEQAIQLISGWRSSEVSNRCCGHFPVTKTTVIENQICKTRE
jgi:hypothetical protein